MHILNFSPLDLSDSHPRPCNMSVTLDLLWNVLVTALGLVIYKCRSTIVQVCHSSGKRQKEIKCLSKKVLKIKKSQSDLHTGSNFGFEVCPIIVLS